MTSASTSRWTTASAQSISLYNQGGGVPNAEGKPHQQVWTSGTPVRSGRWHHLAITYDGDLVSYFLDGVLRGRKQGPQDFSLGVQVPRPVARLLRRHGLLVQRPDG